MMDKRREPRRQYEWAFKRRAVGETLVDGATIAAVARLQTQRNGRTLDAAGRDGRTLSNYMQ